MTNQNPVLGNAGVISPTPEQKRKARDNAWLDKTSSYKPTLIETSLEELQIQYDQQTWYRFDIDGFVIDIFAYIRSGSDKLVISGQDAIQRRLVQLPYFYRWSWHNDLVDSFITINDPTLYMSDKLDGGWHQGYKSAWAMDVVGKILERFRELLGVPSDKVLLYGISAGGFWALMSSVYFPNCSVITEIAQVDLFSYEDEGPRQAMLSRCYKGRSLEFIAEKYATRMRVIDRWISSASLPRRVWMFHNIKDVRNTRTQIDPFWDEVQKLQAEGFLSEIEDIKFIFYNRITQKGGHVPMEKAETLKVIKSALEFI